MLRTSWLLLAVASLGLTPTHSLARTDAERFKPGTQIKTWLAHDQPVTPALAGERAYQDFLRASKARSFEALKKLNNDLYSIRNGRVVEVQAYHDPKTFFIRAPAVEVKILDAASEMDGRVVWVAAQYLREPMASLLPGEFPLPAFSYTRDAAYEATPGDEIETYHKTKDAVFVTSGMTAYDDYVKAVIAADEEGLAELIKKGGIVSVKTGTKFRVLDRHENRYIGKGNAAVEGRILEGPYKGQTVWVAEVYTAKYVIVIAKERMAQPNATTEAKESRPAMLLRMGQGLERSKKVAAAIGYYRQILADHPESDEAKTAGERIKVLGGR